MRAAAVPELVVVDDRTFAGEVDEREEVVVRRAWPAVEDDERRRHAVVAGAEVARDAVPRLRILAAEREGNGALANVQAAASLRSSA
jgi:hypothetical protein